jgi:hypothetical protein
MSPSLPPCEDLADKKKCKLARKCKNGSKSAKCHKRCAKDVCKKYMNKKMGTCKKRGKNLCSKTCCELSKKAPSPDPICKAFCEAVHITCSLGCGLFPAVCIACDAAKLACLAVCPLSAL